MPAPYPVTIVAKRPDKQYGPFLPDTAKLINPLVDKLRKGGADPKRASSMSDVETIVERATKAAKSRPIAVQIVGHGLSGCLRIGASYTSQGNSGSSPFFCADTNPDAANFLINYRGAIEELSLLGCNVGLISDQTWPLSGRALLYCFCDLLRCTIKAPVETISPDDFEPNGTFTGSTISVTYSPKRGPVFGSVTPAVRPTTRPQRVAGAKPATVHVEQILGTVLPSRRPGPQQFKYAMHVFPVRWDKLASATREVTLRAQGGADVHVVDHARHAVIGSKQYEVCDPRALADALRPALW